MGPPSTATSWTSRLRLRPPRQSSDHLRCRKIRKKKVDNIENRFADLPMLVLFHILDELVDVVDQLRFSKVCKYWNSAYNLRKEVLPSIPMLLLPTRRKGKAPTRLKQEKRSLYSAATGSLLGQKLEISYGKRVCGSCYGWLGTLDEIEGSDEQLVINLINPYYKHHPPIKLPPLNCTRGKYYEYTIAKLILTSDPALHPNEFIVVVCFSASTLGKLAIFKATSDYWFYLEDIRPPLYADAIVHKDTVYVVGKWNNMVSFCLKDRNWPPKINRVSPRTLEGTVEGVYLVETSKGEVLLVNRFIDPNPNISRHLLKTISFKVFKIIFEEETKELVSQVEVKHLDGETLFLGTSYSTAVLAPRILSPNSIYFTHDYHSLGMSKFGHHDIGIFCLEDQSFREHYKFDSKLEKLLPPSIWSLPPLLATC